MAYSVQEAFRQTQRRRAIAEAEQRKAQEAQATYRTQLEQRQQEDYEQQLQHYQQLYGGGAAVMPGTGEGALPPPREEGAVRPGGGIPSGVQDIITQMQEAQTGATEANLQRYQEMMGGFEGLGVAAGERQQQVMEQLGGIGEAAGERHEQIMAQMEGLGTAGRARIQRETTQRQAGAAQQLVSRGLGSTTITSAVERGIAREGETATQELEERVAGQKAGAISAQRGVEAQLGMQRVGAMERGGAAATQLGVQKLGMMERRTDLGPDMGMFANLIGALMQGQQGQGQGGGMPPPPPSRPMPIAPQAAAPLPPAAQVISGGLGPMARRGLTAFGSESKYFGRSPTASTAQRQRAPQQSQGGGSAYRPVAAAGTGATGVAASTGPISSAMMGAMGGQLPAWQGVKRGREILKAPTRLNIQGMAGLSYPGG